MTLSVCCFLFFFNDTSTTEIYTLSLHDALPISNCWKIWHDQQTRIDLSTIDSLCNALECDPGDLIIRVKEKKSGVKKDRKSTRLNSSHMSISYAVFCLKKKKKKKKNKRVMIKRQ